MTLFDQAPAGLTSSHLNSSSRRPGRAAPRPTRGARSPSSGPPARPTSPVTNRTPPARARGRRRGVRAGGARAAGRAVGRGLGPGRAGRIQELMNSVFLPCGTPRYKRRITTRKQAKDPGQRNHLLLEPVLMGDISTGCINSRYSWPAPSAGKARHDTNRCQYTDKGTG